jgi:hypothetical protein
MNAVPHGELRRVCSQQSRHADVAPVVPPPSSSRIVIDVLNPLKRRYPFIALLKPPETASALPIAAEFGALRLLLSLALECPLAKNNCA